ncbi:MAG TPA: carboxypeptidase-like regulatory domain-containing protein [Bryobacteraceae bacterium]|nr:carboxypeptidase-like regulatory domain-containing protein [Bryobacteraceae bacterium]
MLLWAKFLILALSLLLIGSHPSASQIARGSLDGTITNASGPVAKAAVEIRNVITGLFLHTESDAKGNYKFESLRAGRYSLWVHAPGNDSIWIPDVFVENGHITHYSVKLGSAHEPAS